MFGGGTDVLGGWAILGGGMCILGGGWAKSILSGYKHSLLTSISIGNVTIPEMNGNEVWNELKRGSLQQCMPTCY